MAEVVDNAGLTPETPPADARKEVVKAARAVMRKLDATDDEYEDALEALLELAKP